VKNQFSKIVVLEQNPLTENRIRRTIPRLMERKHDSEEPGVSAEEEEQTQIAMTTAEKAKRRTCHMNELIEQHSSNTLPSSVQLQYILQVVLVKNFLNYLV
jgi:hypothetical protein